MYSLAARENIVSEGDVTNQSVHGCLGTLPDAERSPITSSRSAPLVDPSPTCDLLTNTTYRHTKHTGNSALPILSTHNTTTNITGLHSKPASCKATSPSLPITQSLLPPSSPQAEALNAHHASTPCTEAQTRRFCGANIRTNSRHSLG